MVDVVWLLVSLSWEDVWVVLGFVMVWTPPLTHMDYFVKEVGRDVCGIMCTRFAWQLEPGCCGLGDLVMARDCLI